MSIWIRVADPADPGHRLVLERDTRGWIALIEELVLPERAMSPDARRREQISCIDLTEEDLRWLHKATGELLKEVTPGKESDR